MKKIIIGTLVLIALSITAFAGGNKADKKLLSDLTMALKNSTEVQHSSTDAYTRATFSFNGKTTSAYYDVDYELIGFSIRIKESELLQAALETMKKKYSNWTVVDAIIFIDGNANVKYYAQLKKDKKNLAIELSANGHANILQQMFPE